MPTLTKTPFIRHTFRSGSVVTQPMYDLGDARQELAAIVRNFRAWKHYVVRDGHHKFFIAPIDGVWSKTVEIVWR